MNKNNKFSNEDLYKFTAMMMNLPYEDEFRRVKVKTKELDIFLKDVAEGKIRDSKEFIREGLNKTITAALLSIIKEKLKRYASKYKDKMKGKAAFMVLQFLYQGLPLDSNVFFIAVFIRSALNHPLADNNKVWTFLYEFLPKKIETKATENIEKPEFKGVSGDKFEDSKSGLLTPKKKELQDKEESRIIIPGGGVKK
jgi:hypothetical protein